MANKKVTLVRLCKTPTGWKRLPIVMGANGKVRPGYAVLDGKQGLYPEGHYELRTYEGTKTVYRNVGDDAAEALAAQKRETHLLVAKDAAGSAGVQIVGGDTKRINLRLKAVDYIDRHLAKGQKRASETSKIAIDGFLEATGLTYADQVTETAILSFYRHLRKAGNQDRTIYNKHMSLFGFFKWLGIDAKKMVDKPPSYTEREVEIYGPEELRELFDSCTEYQRVVFETLLKTGLRMQEAMHLQWSNVDFRGKVIRVREILDSEQGNNVRIKDRSERSLPLPDDLAVTLHGWRKQNPGTTLVLGTSNDTPNWKWLLMLKRAVRKAGLNCGKCTGCRRTNECSRWWIHKFRATYTTTLLTNGIDARTVMSYTGHENLATVLRYLAPAAAVPMQKKVSAIKWTA
jgi:integrase